MSARVVVFHTLAHARAGLAAAAAAGVQLTLRTAPGAAAYAGAQYLKAIVDTAAAEFPGVALTAVIDCGGDAGTAQGALRTGWKALCFSGPESVRAKIADIAGQHDATLVADDPAAAVLDLLDQADPEGACRAFLTGNSA